MVKGRSNYNIPFVGDRNSINNLILDYLAKNAFTPVDNATDLYYENEEKTRGLKYIITTGNVNISAWVIDKDEGEIAVENNALKSECNDYKTSLGILFNDINILNATNYNIIQEETEKKEKQPLNFYDVIAAIGVWLGVLGLVLAFFNKKFAIVLFVVDIVTMIFSYNNDRKKQGKSIAILFVVSVIIMILVNTLNISLPF